MPKTETLRIKKVERYFGCLELRGPEDGDIIFLPRDARLKKDFYDRFSGGEIQIKRTADKLTISHKGGIVYQD